MTDPPSTNPTQSSGDFWWTKKRRMLAIGAAVLVVGAGIGLVVALSGGGSNNEDTTPETTTSTTTTTLPTWPLTGVPDALAPTAGNHAAIVVKIDNNGDARPQTGINEADVVYELLVEGITRFALVFHSKLPEPVGPVRSARSSDVDLVANLSKPLFVWSGGNPGVVGEIQAAQRNGILTDASYNLASAAYYRSNDRMAPQNLYVRLPQLLEMMTPQGQGAPAPIFTFLPVQGPAATTTTTSPSTTVVEGVTTTTILRSNSVAVPAFTIDFQGAKVDYAWDVAAKGWRRFQVDGTHSRANSATVDQVGVQVTPTNVVVMFLDYGQSPSDSRSPMAFSVGSGPVLVFVNGQLTQGTWNRPKADQPATFTDATGRPILLAPGRTWVEMPRKGQQVSLIDAAGADQFLAVKR